MLFLLKFFGLRRLLALAAARQLWRLYQNRR
jgi:hypothetical protein